MRKYTKEEIKIAIKEAGYNKQQDLADKMGISKSDLSNRISYGSDEFIRELEINYGIKFRFNTMEVKKLLKRIDELLLTVDKMKKQNQEWQAYSASLLEEMEKHGIDNKQLRIKFYALVKKSGDDKPPEA